MLDDARVLVIGVSGYIGFALARTRLDHGVRVMGTDNQCGQYGAAVLKELRLAAPRRSACFTFVEAPLTDEGRCPRQARHDVR